MLLALLGALAIGLSLGLLGSGGSILTVPVLHYLVGQPEKLAIGGSLLVVGLIAAAACVPYALHRQVDWRNVAWFGLPLCAVLDADAQDVQDYPERWSSYFGPLQSPHITIAWSALSLVPSRPDPWLGKLGGYSRARRLINLAATGQL